MISRNKIGLEDYPQHALLTGKVIDNVDPHKRGRLKIVLPKYSDTTEYWAYPVSPSFGGGSGTKDNPTTDSWGWYCVPRIGDHVAVMAMHADLSALFVIGGIPSMHQNMPGAKADPDNYQFRTHNGHVMTYRSNPTDSSVSVITENGHTILLDDANAKIVLSTVNGHTLLLDDTNAKVSLSTVNGYHLTIDDANNLVTIQKSGSIIQIDAAGNISLSTTQNVNVTAANLNVTANTAITGTLTNNGVNVGSTHSHTGNLGSPVSAPF